MAAAEPAPRVLENGTKLTNRDIHVISVAISDSMSSNKDPSQTSGQTDSKLYFIRTQRLLEELMKCLIIAERNARNLREALGCQFPLTDNVSTSNNIPSHNLKGFALMAEPFDNEFFRRLDAISLQISSSSRYNSLEHQRLSSSLMTHFLSAYRRTNGEIEATSSEQHKSLSNIQISVGNLLYTINELKQRLQGEKESIQGEKESIEKKKNWMDDAIQSSKQQTLCNDQMNAKRIAAINQALHTALHAGKATLADLRRDPAGCQSQAEDYLSFSLDVVNVLKGFKKCLETVQKHRRFPLMPRKLKNPFPQPLLNNLDKLYDGLSPLLEGVPVYYYEDKSISDGIEKDTTTVHPWKLKIFLLEFLFYLDKCFNSVCDKFDPGEFDALLAKFLARMGQFNSFLEGCVRRIGVDRENVQVLKKTLNERLRPKIDGRASTEDVGLLQPYATPVGPLSDDIPDQEEDGEPGRAAEESISTTVS